MTDIKEAQGLEVVNKLDVWMSDELILKLSDAQAVIDQLRKQLDEAKKLLDKSADECGPSMSRYINTWLETNK